MRAVHGSEASGRRGMVRAVALLIACLPVVAQVSTPGDAPPPKANPQTILDRAVEMYESKKYATALLAFEEAAAAGKTASVQEREYLLLKIARLRS